MKDYSSHRPDNNLPINWCRLSCFVGIAAFTFVFVVGLVTVIGWIR